MAVGSLIARARQAAGVSQQELARRAGTSRPTVSAYEHGRKSPTLDTAARLLDVLGFDLLAQPRPCFHEVGEGRSTVSVPDRLPRLPAEQALARVTLPLHLAWSGTERTHDLSRRQDRARVYETVLREGTAEDVERYVDGALLVDLWDELVLPRAVRHAWQPILDATLGRTTHATAPDAAGAEETAGADAGVTATSRDAVGTAAAGVPE